MRLHVEFSTSATSMHCAAKVQMRDGSWYPLKEWSARDRSLDMSQLDDIWACVACELDLQQVLF